MNALDLCNQQLEDCLRKHLKAKDGTREEVLADVSHVYKVRRQIID